MNHGMRSWLMYANYWKGKVSLLQRGWWLAAVLMLAGCANRPAIELQEPWLRAAAGGENSAAYFVIHNQGAADKLLAVESEAAEQVQIHRSIIDDQGIASMVEQKRVTIAANADTTFEPGGLHVMLIRLKEPLVAGDSIKLRLHFERSGTYEIEAAIRNP